MLTRDDLDRAAERERMPAVTAVPSEPDEAVRLAQASIC
jgi:hypothetical protein